MCRSYRTRTGEPQEPRRSGSGELLDNQAFSAYTKPLFPSASVSAEAAIKVIDQALKVLSKKPRKKAAKRSGRRKR